MTTEFTRLIDLLSSKGDRNVCNTLNDYFRQEGVRELLDSGDERCMEFLETVSRTSKGLIWFLDRVALVKEQKQSRKRERDEAWDPLLQTTTDNKLSPPQDEK